MNLICTGHTRVSLKGKERKAGESGIGSRILSGMEQKKPLHENYQRPAQKVAEWAMLAMVYDFIYQRPLICYGASFSQCL